METKQLVDSHLKESPRCNSPSTEPHILYTPQLPFFYSDTKRRSVKPRSYTSKSGTGNTRKIKSTSIPDNPGQRPPVKFTVTMNDPQPKREKKSSNIYNKTVISTGSYPSTHTIVPVTFFTFFFSLYSTNGCIV